MRRVGVFFLLLSIAAGAAEMRSVDVDRVDGRYVMHSEVWFAAEIEALHAVFLDYSLSTRFSESIVEARNIEPDEAGRRGYYVRNRGCVLFFCTSFERYGFVEHEAPRFIRATVDPEVSDFDLTNESWKFHREGDGTVVTYDLEFRPKFWVPPVIGPYVIKQTLKDHGDDAIDRIEAIAREMQK